MTELVRPALYGAIHPIVALTSGRRPVAAWGTAARPATRATSVHGPICESTDLLGDHELPPLVRGDLVAIGDAGAYGASMAMSYNGRPRPIQLTLAPDGALNVARRRGRLAPVLGCR
jgi:diaminopimelate decarboxylase